MGWFDALFGNDNDDNGPPRRPGQRNRGQRDRSRERDPFGRVLPESTFEAFRSAWNSRCSIRLAGF